MADEKKVEVKEGHRCGCGHDHADGKCCCKYKKYFPHNWFKLRCLTHIFNTFFYLGIIASVYMIYQLVLFIKYAKSGMIPWDSLPQMIALVMYVVVSTFIMLAIAKVCKALRKIKCHLKECKENKK